MLLIRQQNADWLRQHPDYLGSAVGYKYLENSDAFAEDTTGHRIPAVLVFVRRKITEVELAPGRVLPKILDGPDGLTCATDVIEGALPTSLPAPPPLSAANETILTQLADPALGLIGGQAITAEGRTGTAACVIEVRNELGFLTNWHVAGMVDTMATRGSYPFWQIGQTVHTVFTAPSTPEDPTDLESYTNAEHRLDAGFVGFIPARPLDAKPGVHGLGPLGELHILNLDTMDLVGTDVVSVGQRLGKQTGTIAAYGYEWHPYPGYSVVCATDYLILGHDLQPFAAPGDSGKLVVTADGLRPVALLWGGEHQQFWNVAAQQTWSYASTLDLVLRSLGAKIFH